MKKYTNKNKLIKYNITVRFENNKINGFGLR